MLHCGDGVWSWVVHSGCMCGSFDERHIFVACSCAHTRRAPRARYMRATRALHACYTYGLLNACCMHMHMLHVHVHALRGWGSVNHTVTSRLPLDCHTLATR